MDPRNMDQEESTGSDAHEQHVVEVIDLESESDDCSVTNETTITVFGFGTPMVLDCDVQYNKIQCDVEEASDKNRLEDSVVADDNADQKPPKDCCLNCESLKLSLADLRTAMDDLDRYTDFISDKLERVLKTVSRLPVPPSPEAVTGIAPEDWTYTYPGLVLVPDNSQKSSGIGTEPSTSSAANVVDAIIPVAPANEANANATSTAAPEEIVVIVNQENNGDNPSLEEPTSKNRCGRSVESISRRIIKNQNCPIIIRKESIAKPQPVRKLGRPRKISKPLPESSSSSSSDYFSSSSDSESEDNQSGDSDKTWHLNQNHLRSRKRRFSTRIAQIKPKATVTSASATNNGKQK